jgi:hypothetical protein
VGGQSAPDERHEDLTVTPLDSRLILAHSIEQYAAQCNNRESIVLAALEQLLDSAWPTSELRWVAGESMARVGSDIRRWAILGAEQRLLALSEEATAIYKQFPELRERSGAAVSPARKSAARPKPRKRRMSAAGRKAIGDAARRRWAKVRARRTRQLQRPPARSARPYASTPRLFA